MGITNNITKQPGGTMKPVHWLKFLKETNPPRPPHASPVPTTHGALFDYASPNGSPCRKTKSRFPFMSHALIPSFSLRKPSSRESYSASLISSSYLCGAPLADRKASSTSLTKSFGRPLASFNIWTKISRLFTQTPEEQIW